MSDDEALKKRSAMGPIWWRLIVGVLLILDVVRVQFFPDPNVPEYLKPDNATQRMGMEVSYVLIAALGVWLVYSGLTKRRNARMRASNSDDSKQ
ncbi:hypothetical protein ACFPT7_00680 [Acidicapsa dinghuensis]|uniref:Uncharacterized protein n=1 Tax=Acidicapsa dinghuensis TaxID=2218256 RepID=A0ABW1EC46_9BACT|nr:hypothetical protein [Acidicapsa dinghuensis]